MLCLPPVGLRRTDGLDTLSSSTLHLRCGRLSVGDNGGKMRPMIRDTDDDGSSVRESHSQVPIANEAAATRRDALISPYLKLLSSPSIPLSEKEDGQTDWSHLQNNFSWESRLDMIR